jgi:hypothetical protein
MTFDLGRIMEQKQERECARLDDFDFRLRARTIKIVAAWIQERLPDPALLDPSHWVREIATRSFETILADLRAASAGPVDEAVWRDVVGRAHHMARIALLQEIGDPTPIRLG